MPVSRFPCRACGRLTAADDAYIICDECLADMDDGRREPVGIAVEVDDRRSENEPWSLLSPDEVNERLRRLLDDW